jgi:3-phenylpropionate/trans-cinnamate dioxygenase ferredoxin subunit
VEGFVHAGTLEDFPVSEVKHRILGGEQVCIANSNGTLYAFSAFCTHIRVSLRGSEVDRKYLYCWLHWSVFDLETGDCLDGPGRGNPLTVYPVRLEGEDVYVSIEAGTTPEPVPNPR